VLKSIQEGSGILPRYNPQLLEMEGRCKLELGRFREALDTYLKIRIAQPKIWTTYYNLGTVHERLKQRKEAMDNYKLALDFNPPDDMRQSINARIHELGTVRAPARKGQKN
jgi:tetratricopeptide (TPR) repeat protein